MASDDILKLTSGLLGRMILESDSPFRLWKARDRFVAWASEEPQNSVPQMLLAQIEAQLKVVGKKEPRPIHISTRASDIVDELDLPDDPMLEFLSEAEILIESDGHDPDKTYELMVQAAWEFMILILLVERS